MTSEQRVVHVTYGFRGRTRADVLSELEAALGVTFEKRESSYIGEYKAYSPSQPASIESEMQLSLRLRDNLDPLDHMPAREDHPNVVVLLEVSSTSREHADEMQYLICGRLGESSSRAVSLR
jgi:hypothetical protein